MPKNLFPENQQWLLELMQKFGYPPADASGVCFGISYMAVQAFLADEIDLFDKRLKELYTLSQKLPSLTEEEQLDPNKIHAFHARIQAILARILSRDKKLEFDAFFNGIELIHQAHLYRHLFSIKGPMYQTYEHAMDYVISAKLREQGGLYPADFFTGVYSLTDLEKYFISLRSSLGENSKLSLPLFLHSFEHAICVSYQHNNWMFFDIEKGAVTVCKTEAELALEVKKAFGDNNVTTFSTTAFAKKADKTQAKNVIEKWHAQKDLVAMHEVYPETSWLMMAILDDDTDKAIELINKGANVNVARENKMTPLYLAALKGNKEVVRNLLHRQAKTDVYCFDGETPLTIAAKQGHDDIVMLLIANGADINFQRKNDCASALFLAALNGHASTVQMLLDNGANPNIARTPDNATPLAVASMHGNKDVVKKLLAKGADVTLALKSGETPKTLAQCEGFDEVAQILRVKEMEQKTKLTSFNFFDKAQKTAQKIWTKTPTSTNSLTTLSS